MFKHRVNGASRDRIYRESSACVACPDGSPFLRMPFDHACRSIAEDDEIKWNDLNEMSVEKYGMKFVVGKKREKPEENLPRPRGGPGSIPGEVTNFDFFSGTGCVSFVCLLTCVISGSGLDILLTRDFRVHVPVYLFSVRSDVCAPLQESDPLVFGL